MLPGDCPWSFRVLFPCTQRTENVSFEVGVSEVLHGAAAVGVYNR